MRLHNIKWISKILSTRLKSIIKLWRLKGLLLGCLVTFSVKHISNTLGKDKKTDQKP